LLQLCEQRLVLLLPAQRLLGQCLEVEAQVDPAILLGKDFFQMSFGHILLPMAVYTRAYPVDVRLEIGVRGATSRFFGYCAACR